MKKQKETLDKLVNCTDDISVNRYLSEKEKLNELLYHEEVYWKQRAKIFWLAEGDANTRFFHANASARKKTNHISFLVNGNGDKVESQEGMCNIVRSYFSEIFSASSSLEEETIVNSRLVTTEENDKLVSRITFDEFSLAVKQMHPDKASGPDGLNPAFFQHFWSILGKEVFHSCEEWLEKVSFPANLNDTNIVLIPKKENACSMKDLRPIALCNVLYKILAKVLANRLKTILPGIVSENQSAFVPGRSITDNVLVAFEVIHHMKKKNRGLEGEVALKLDISKAYDRVDWNYLKRRMLEMGFCQKWIKWMMLCVTTVSYEVCLNGSSIGPIFPRRGLRQGDPLSPYLFLLCVEGLSNSLDRAAADGRVHGCRVATSAPSITHLLFADDSFQFFKATVAETEAVKDLLNTYERYSGQSVNFQKSGIFFSANVQPQLKGVLSDILGVHKNLSDSHYLGLPSLVGRSKKKVFGFVKDKVWKRIQGWKAKQISRAGKTVLIKNAAQSIPSYCMSCFLLPKSLCQEIERMMNNYWWSSSASDRRGINWLSWENMSMMKSKGGLGFVVSTVSTSLSLVSIVGILLRIPKLW